MRCGIPAPYAVRGFRRDEMYRAAPRPSISPLRYVLPLFREAQMYIGQNSSTRYFCPPHPPGAIIAPTLSLPFSLMRLCRWRTLHQKSGDDNSPHQKSFWHALVAGKMAHVEPELRFHLTVPGNPCTIRAEVSPFHTGFESGTSIKFGILARTSSCHSRRDDARRNRRLGFRILLLRFRHPAVPRHGWRRLCPLPPGRR